MGYRRKPGRPIDGGAEVVPVTQFRFIPRPANRRSRNPGNKGEGW